MGNQICPKCRTGIMRRQGFSSSNWRCELCGYKQYIPAPKANTNTSSVYSKINRINAESARNDADFDEAYRGVQAAARRAEEAAKAKRKANAKSGGGALKTIIIAAIIFYILFRFL